jgi:hypothetical protein
MEFNRTEAEQLAYLVCLEIISEIFSIKFNKTKGFFREAYETGPGGMYGSPEKIYTFEEVVAEYSKYPKISKRNGLPSVAAKKLEENIELFTSREFESWLKLVKE